MWEWTPITTNMEAISDWTLLGMHRRQSSKARFAGTKNRGVDNAELNVGVVHAVHFKNPFRHTWPIDNIPMLEIGILPK